MTSSVRYGEYTNVQAIATTDDVQRSEPALETVKVIAPVIAQGAAAIIWKTKSPGTIKAVMSTRLTSVAGLEKYGAADANAWSYTVTDAGKTLTLTVPAAGTAIVAGDFVYLTLVVGY